MREKVHTLLLVPCGKLLEILPGAVHYVLVGYMGDGINYLSLALQSVGDGQVNHQRAIIAITPLGIVVFGLLLPRHGLELDDTVLEGVIGYEPLQPGVAGDGNSDVFLRILNLATRIPLQQGKPIVLRCWCSDSGSSCRCLRLRCLVIRVVNDIERFCGFLRVLGGLGCKTAGILQHQLVHLGG